MLGFAESAARDGNYLFYVRIPGDIGPLQRGDLYEEPLQEALTSAGVGEVTGGGSQLGEGNSVEYCGIDMVATIATELWHLYAIRCRGWALLPRLSSRSIYPLTESMNWKCATPNRSLMRTSLYRMSHSLGSSGDFYTFSWSE